MLRQLIELWMSMMTSFFHGHPHDTVTQCERKMLGRHRLRGSLGCIMRLAFMYLMTFEVRTYEQLKYG